MKSITAVFSSLLVSATLLLSACGGGGSLEVSGSSSPPPPAFDIIAVVNGSVVPGPSVLPGEARTLVVRVGSTFLFDSSGDVVYRLVVGGRPIVGSGNLIYYGNVAIQERPSTTRQYAASTSPTAPLLGPVPITLYATSVYDGNQVSRIDIEITN